MCIRDSIVSSVFCQWPPHHCHCLLCLLPVTTHHLFTVSSVSCQWPPSTFTVSVIDHPPLSAFCQWCGTQQDKPNQTQSNQKTSKTTQSDLTHNETPSHTLCVPCYWVEQQISWRSDFQISFWSFSFLAREVLKFYIVHRIILNLLIFQYFWPNSKNAAQQAVDF